MLSWFLVLNSVSGVFRNCWMMGQFTDATEALSGVIVLPLVTLNSCLLVT